MLFKEIYKNPNALFLGAVIYFFTCLSYEFGEKSFFLIPLILIPLYSIQCSTYLPMAIFILAFPTPKFEGIDMSSLKRLFKIAIFFECGITIAGLTYAFHYGEFVPITIAYSIYAILVILYLTLRFQAKFYEEAKKQNVDVKIKSFKFLFASMREQINVIKQATIEKKKEEKDWYQFLK